MERVINFKALLQDKKFIGVVAVGTLVGGFALYRSKGSGAAGTADAAGSVAGSAGSGTPTFNDGGSDIAATLGNFSTELQGILQNYANSQGSGATVPPPKAPVNPVIVAVHKAAGKPKPPPKPPTTTTYKIKKGDTLSELAVKNHTTVSALAKLNGIKNVNLIYAGHTLKIPKKK